MIDKLKESSVTIEVLIQPKSSRDEIVGLHDGRLKIKISAPPVEGKANERLTEVMAKALGVPKSSVDIVRGKSSRLKTLKISGIDGETCESFISKYRGK